MPKRRDPDRGSLPMAVLHVLAHGDLPVEHVSATGRVAAFELKHYPGRPGVVAEMPAVCGASITMSLSPPRPRVASRGWSERSREPSTKNENEEPNDDEGGA